MTTLNEIPFIRIILPFLTGIILYFSFASEAEIYWWVVASLLLTLGVYAFLTKTTNSNLKPLFGVALNIFLILFGYHLCIISAPKYAAQHYTHFKEMPRVFTAQVVSVPVAGEKTFKAELQLLEGVSADKLQKLSGKIISYFSNKDSMRPAYGDLFVLRASLREIDSAKNPGGFNYKEYLNSKGIYHSVYIDRKNAVFIKNQSVFWLKDLAISIKLRLLDVLKSNALTGQELAIASSLLLGYDEEISSELSSAYAITGTIHILSVSGMHLGIIYMMLNFMLGFLERRRHGVFIKGILVLAGVWLFALISGFSPSVIRAAVMFSLLLIGKSFKLHTNTFNTLLASAFLILLTDPFLLKDIGFQLSYLALGGILLFQPTIYRWFNFRNAFADRTWALCSVSLAAQLTTFPISMYYFHNFSVSFLLANLIIIPLSTLIMYGGILLLATSVFHAVSTFIATLLTYMIFAMNYCAVALSHLPFSHISEININLPQLIVIYLIILFAVLWLLEARKHLLYTALSAMCVLLVLFVAESYEISKQKKLVVFHQKKGPVFEFINGTQAICVGELNTEISTANQSLGVTEVSTLPVVSGIIYKANGNSVVLTNGEEMTGTPMTCDAVVLDSRGWVNLKNIKSAFGESVIVADGNIRFKKLIKLKAVSDSLNLRFWSTSEQGAFILDKQ